MKIGSVDVKTVDECLEVLEGAFQSDMWRDLNNQDKIRIVGKLEHVLELAQLRSMPKCPFRNFLNRLNQLKEADSAFRVSNYGSQAVDQSANSCFGRVLVGIAAG